MEDLVIPGWALALISGIGTLLLGWLLWLTMRTNQNDKAIALNTANDLNVTRELDKIYQAVGKLDGKLDMFLANELSFLKDQIRK